MKCVKLYLIEGKRYYARRNIKLPEMINTNTDVAYCYTNTQSITNLISIIFLKLFGKFVYFLPDGIFECSNIKRKTNILGLISLKISNGVLVGDIYSYETARHIGMAAIKVSRWKKVDCKEINLRGNKTIIATAKNPFFNKIEEKLLNKALVKVINDFDDKSKLLTSMPESMFGNLPFASFGIQNLIKCNHVIRGREISKVISTPSTLIIEALVNNISCSLLPFRSADYILVPDCNYPNEFTYDYFVFSKLKNCVINIDSYFAKLTIVEQLIKEATKKLLN